MALRISPMSAQLIVDLDLFSKMDPYVVIQIGKTKFKTQCHEQGGKNPKWNDVHDFEIKGLPEQEKIHIQIWDKDIFFDENVGEVSIPLIDWLKTPNELQIQNLILSKKNISVGTIRIRYVYFDGKSPKKKSSESKPTQQDISPSKKPSSEDNWITKQSQQKNPKFVYLQNKSNQDSFLCNQKIQNCQKINENKSQKKETIIWTQQIIPTKNIQKMKTSQNKNNHWIDQSHINKLQKKHPQNQNSQWSNLLEHPTTK